MDRPFAQGIAPTYNPNAPRHFHVETISSPVGFPQNPCVEVARLANSAYSGFERSSLLNGIALTEDTLSSADILFEADSRIGLDISIIPASGTIFGARLCLPLLEGGLASLAKSGHATAGIVLTRTKQFVSHILASTMPSHKESLEKRGVVGVIPAHLAICLGPKAPHCIVHPSILSPYWSDKPDHNHLAWRHLHLPIAQGAYETHCTHDNQPPMFLLAEKGKPGGVAWVLTERHPLSGMPSLALLSYHPVTYYKAYGEAQKVIVETPPTCLPSYNIGLYWIDTPPEGTTFIYVNRSANS